MARNFVQRGGDQAAHEPLGLIAVVVSLVGLIVSVVAVYFALRHDKHMAKQVEDLGTISGSLTEHASILQEVRATIPTRLCSSFADHLRYIATLIRAAGQNADVKIMVDCADYGSFFDPQAHKLTVDALIDARSRHGKVQMFVAGPAQHITRTSRYHGKTFDELMRDSDFCATFERYLKFLRRDIYNFKDVLQQYVDSEQKRTDFLAWLCGSQAFSENSPLPADQEQLKHCIESCIRVVYDNAEWCKLDEAAFQLLLLARERFFEELLSLNGVSLCRVVKSQPAIFFWLRTGDRSEAAFMFANTPREDKFSTMSTVDFTFATFFREFFDSEWRDAPCPAERNRSGTAITPA